MRGAVYATVGLVQSQFQHKKENHHNRHNYCHKLHSLAYAQVFLKFLRQFLPAAIAANVNEIPQRIISRPHKLNNN